MSDDNILEVEATADAEKKFNLLELEVNVPTEDGGTEKKTIRFRPLTTIPIGLVRQTRHDKTEQMWAVFEWALPDEDLAIFDRLPSTVLYSTIADMQKASGITLGE